MNKISNGVTTIGLISILILSSCDNSEDFFKDLNDRPTISLTLDDESGGVLRDSVKTSGQFGQFPIDLVVQIDDLNGNIEGVNINNVGGSPYLLVQFDSILIDLEIVSIDPVSNQVALTAFFFEEGLHDIRFVAIDAFETSDTAQLVLNVFENLPPVVGYSVDNDDLSPDALVFDLSSSRDGDDEFGGEIISYHFLIDGNIDVRSQPTITYNFPGRGDYAISLFVTDNNNEMSETVSFNVSVN